MTSGARLLVDGGIAFARNVLALRAIWLCWNDGTPLDFRGDYFHGLQT